MATDSKQAGFGLIEALIAASIVSAFIIVLVSINTYYAEVAFRKGPLVEASFLGDEALEAVKAMRDASWDAYIDPLVIDTSYYLLFDGVSWSITTTPQWIGRFERTIIFRAVYRDANSEITSLGGTLDPETRLVEAHVAWFDRTATTTRTVRTYITDIFDN